MATGTLTSAPAVILLIQLVSNALIKKRTGMKIRPYAVPLKIMTASIVRLQINGMLFSKYVAQQIAYNVQPARDFGINIKKLAVIQMITNAKHAV